MSNVLFSVILWTLAGENAGTPELRDLSADPFAAATDVLSFSFEEEEDRDVDGVPDEWNRRRSPGFPGYVRCQIDPEHGHVGEQSFHARINGGRIAWYSPFNNDLARVDPAFNYVFRGFIRTEHLQNDAALYSISFLNSRRQRVQRFVTKPVTGTHAKWVPLELGPLQPHSDARYVVIGCHVVHGEDQDIRGDVWFDGLWLGKLPRLTLVNRAQDHFLTPKSPIVINAEVSGLEPGVNFGLFMSLADVTGKVLHHENWPLKLPTDHRPTSEELTRSIPWSLRPREHGCYFVRAHLERDGRLMLLSETTIAVADPARSRPGGEFGWSLASGTGRLSTDEITFVASQAGINWLKLPLWKSMHEEGTASPNDVAEMLERLSDRSISVVGLLNDPPTFIRNQFARQWAGISEIFVLPPEFWSPSLEPVLARYGSAVEYWQLGGDDDASFAGMSGLEDVTRNVKREFDRIGRNSRIGVQWPWPTELPIPDDIRNLFVTVGGEDGLPLPEIEKAFQGKAQPVSEHWAMLRPLPTDRPHAERSSTLVRQMIAARLNSAQGVFLSGVFDGERGLLDKDGAPTPLFLPWRTTALMMREASHLGSFQLPGNPANHVFERDGKAIVIFPGDAPVITELNLGNKVERVDIWGRRMAIPREQYRHQIETSGEPIFCVNCSEQLARWRLETGFESGRIPAEYGGHPDAIVGRNTFNQGVRGKVTLKLPSDWEADPSVWEIELAAGESFRLPTTINLPQTASLGTAHIVLAFEITTDRRRQFDVHRSFEVGLGDVIVDVYDRVLPDGRLEIEQIVSNRVNPPELLNFKCTLSVSGHKSQTEYVTRLGEEKDRKLYYLPNAESLKGQELWLNLEEIGGRRNLNKRLIIGENEDATPRRVGDE